ncbi:unnamed protein product, partial [Closterium sp. NIES-54]
MATPRVLRFDADGRPLDFSVWLLRARRLLESQVQGGETLWSHTTGDLPEPPEPTALGPAPDDAATARFARQRADRTAWTSRDAAACIALSSLLPESEEVHFTQVRTAAAYLTAIKARYSTPATVSLGRLFLPFLFPDLASFERSADLIAHLRSLDASYRAACTEAQLTLLPPPMAITVYFIATSLPDRLASVRDALLSSHSTRSHVRRAIDRSSLASTRYSPPLSSSPPSRSWATRRSPRARPSSSVPFTDLRTAFLRSSPPRPSQSVLPSPPESALTVSLPTPVTDYYRMYRPVLSRVLASLVTHPRVSVSSVSALTAVVTDFASTRRLDYATTLVTAPPTSPLVVGGVSALGCDALEDRQFELEFLAAASPHLCAMLLAPEGDPDALDIPTPRTYAEAVSGPWASQWRAAMDAEMASYRSTGTYVDEVPPPWGERSRRHVDLQGEAATGISPGGHVAVFPDGRHVACPCADAVKVVDLTTGKVVRTLEGDGEPITAVAASPDGVSVLASSRSLQTRWWNWRTGECKRSWKAHPAPVSCLAIDASGGLLATGGADRGVRVWDLEANACTHSFTGMGGVLSCVAFHPDPNQLL